MILLLMAPLAIPIKMTLCPRRPSNSDSPVQQVGSSDSLIKGRDDKIEPLLASSSVGTLGSFYDQDDSSEVAMLLALGEGAVKQKKRRPKRGKDFKFTEAVIKADFWLLFLVFFVGVGTGVTVLNNLTDIGIAQGEEHTTILLSIFSFCNFVGRLGGGVVSEHFVGTKTISRTVSLDDMHTDNYAHHIPSVCLCCQWNPLSCGRISWYLLWCGSFHNAPHCF